MRRPGRHGDAGDPEEGRGPSDEGDAPDASWSLVADEPPPDASLEREQEARRRPTGLLALFALGIVYGDIGTSPLYALRESFAGRGGVTASPGNVLGVLSLVLWSLLLVVSLKYLFYVMRAENDGEGGVLALGALLDPWRKERRGIALLAVFGAALLYGDGAITPAISVLAAVEGLQVAAPATGPWVLPLAVVILVLLFVLQKRGTAVVGSLFGPVMLVWFLTLAALGVSGVLRDPSVLAAANPLHAVRFFGRNGGQGFRVLGAVFLVVTGGEALYADLGHLGAGPIRLGWFGLVLPALLLNYFGQGAALLQGAGVEQPFYALAPEWALWPLVALATAATVIASQAVISGVFSLTRQAMQLGLTPRLRVEQTSEEDIGQVYLPAVNWIMMVATVCIALAFGSSGALAGAYGVAVSTTFVITTLLAYRVSRELWGWGLAVAAAVTGGFLAVDLAFLGANAFKIVDGGWLPLLLAGGVAFLVTTWSRGRRLVLDQMRAGATALPAFLARVEEERPPRIGGTAVFLTSRADGVPPALVRQLDHMGFVHETVVVLTTLTSNVPRVPLSDRLEVRDFGSGVYRVLAHHGFMQQAHVPELLEASGALGVPVGDLEAVTYYVERERPLPVERLGMSLWRARVFALLTRNSPRTEATFGLPPDQVVELGVQVEV